MAEANLNKLNGEFIYRAIINNVLQRPVLVGNANLNYTGLDQISLFKKMRSHHRRPLLLFTSWLYQ
jgi:hypothetical protein